MLIVHIHLTEKNHDREQIKRAVYDNLKSFVFSVM